MVVEVNGYEIKPMANLEWASLGGAKLNRSYLTGANLTGANLEGVDLERATADAERIPQRNERP